jgi:predicted HicB family RNase H-like nuclease
LAKLQVADQVHRTLASNAKKKGVSIEECVTQLAADEKFKDD